MKAKGTVLLVEDNAELNANNARALRLLGHAVHPALTLGEARAWLRVNEPDVILLDVMLPDGDGMDFCAEVRATTKAHILFLTAKTEAADRVRGLSGGGDDYITKPFHPEELLARVEAAMRRRGMSRASAEEAQTPDTAGREKLRAFAAHHDLTEKEREALSCILHQQSTMEMAATMGISTKGVEFHITNILYKTNAIRRRKLLQVYADWDLKLHKKL